MAKKKSGKRTKIEPETKTAREMKKSIAEQVSAVMVKQDISQSELARRMATSRAVVHRLLKNEDVAITLATLANALTALGQTATLKLTAA